MKPKKYIVFGGKVASMNDSDVHYISAKRLVELYKVNINDCILFDESDTDAPMPKGYFTILRPLRNGKYEEFIEKHLR